MPAKTVQEFHQLFPEHMRNGDIDAVLGCFRHQAKVNHSTFGISGRDSGTPRVNSSARRPSSA